MAVKEYFMKIPERPGVINMLGTSDKKLQAEIEAHINENKISDTNVIVDSKPRTISTITKTFTHKMDDIEDDTPDVGAALSESKQTKT